MFTFILWWIFLLWLLSGLATIVGWVIGVVLCLITIILYVVFKKNV
jgi:hypothetical protein